MLLRNCNKRFLNCKQPANCVETIQKIYDTCHELIVQICKHKILRQIISKMVFFLVEDLAILSDRVTATEFAYFCVD